MAYLNGKEILFSPNIRVNPVGRVTEEGGEIFNDYENNKALAENASAVGKGTIANASGQFVQGTWNAPDSECLHIVGNGTDDSHRSNAYKLDKEGNAFFAGSVATDGGQVLPIKNLSGKEVFLEEDVKVVAKEGATIVGDIRERTFDDTQEPPLRSGNIAVGEFSVAIGRCAEALGTYATSIGSRCKAIGDYSFASGNGSVAGELKEGEIPSGNSAVAMGRGAQAHGATAISLGHDTRALGNYSVALGSNTEASGERATALGVSTDATGNASTALGDTTLASGDYSTAIGKESIAAGIGSIAGGYGVIAEGEHSIAFGNVSKAKGNNSVALGHNAETYADYATAIGSGADAKGQYSFALGRNTITEGENSVALGYGSIAKGNSAIVLGRNSEASAEGAISVGGYGTRAISNYAIAIGKQVTSKGYATLALGQGTTAEGNTSTAMGIYTKATGSAGQVVFGRYNAPDENMLLIAGNGTSDSERSNAMTVDSTGNAVFAGTLKVQGDKEVALVDDIPKISVEVPIIDLSGKKVKVDNTNYVTASEGATVIGDIRDISVFKDPEPQAKPIVSKGNVVTGEYAVAIGSCCQATGLNSIAMGYGPRATGLRSFAIGTYSDAIGASSISMGDFSKASGNSSFAASGGIASGEHSVAIGANTEAASSNQTVFGRANIIDEQGKYLFIVGNGSVYESRSNAMDLDWDGNVTFAGSVSCQYVNLVSPNGTQFKLSVDDEGTLVATKL